MIDSNARDGGYPSYAYSRYVVTILLFITALSYLDRQAITVLVVPIQTDLSLTDTQMGLLLGPAFVLFYALVGFSLGQYADRYNRRNILFCGVAIWSTGTVLCGLSRSFEMLFVARAVVGLGEACLVPTVFSLVADYFPPHRRGRATAVVSTGISIGTGIGIFGGGLLLRWADALQQVSWPIIGRVEAWQFIFVVCGLPGIAACLLLMTVREPIRQETASRYQTSDGAEPIRPFLQRHGTTMAQVLSIYFLFAYVQYAMSSWTPTLLARTHGQTPSDAALIKGIIVVVVAPLASLVGGYLSDFLSKRYADGRLRLVWRVGPYALPGLLLITVAPDLWLVVLGLVLLNGFGVQITTTVYATLQDVTPNRLRGRVFASYGLLVNIVGLAFGPTAVALVTDNVFRDPNQLHWSMLIATLPAYALSLILCRAALPRYRRMREETLSDANSSAAEPVRVQPSLPPTGVAAPKAV